MDKPDPKPRRRRRSRRRRPPSPARPGRPAGTGPDKPDPITDEPRPVAPTRQETALLPSFAGLPPEHVHIPKTKAQCQSAAAAMRKAGVVGFDTEAKPTFRAGEKSGGPHVVQFALKDRAYIFQLHRRACEQVAADIIASKEILKVGFGLSNDRNQIRNRLGTELNNVLDLDHVFRKLGYRGQIGVRGAMGALLRKQFRKSKSITTSNWAAEKLTPRQLRYAANDAFAPLVIMDALGKAGHLDP